MPSRNFPKSEAEAIARGFKLIPDIEAFLRSKFKITEQEFSLQKKSFAKGAEVNCATAPKGTKCFCRCYPDGTLVIGYCGSNKTCVYYNGSCAPSDPSN